MYWFSCQNKFSLRYLEFNMSCNQYSWCILTLGQYSFGDALGIEDTSKYGVCHADELYYFWLPYWNNDDWEFNDDEIRQSKLLLHAWSNFAKYGSPTMVST